MRPATRVGNHVRDDLRDLEASAITLSAECGDFVKKHGTAGQRGLVIWAQARADEAADFLRDAREAERE